MKRCLENILFGISCKIQAPTVDLETSLDKKKEHADYCACVCEGGGGVICYQRKLHLTKDRQKKK